MNRRGRIVLLLNNPFVSDSRCWKMARSAAAAGHEVTVVARAAPGLPEREEGSGYGVIRVAQPPAPRWLPAPPLPRPGEKPSRVRDTVGRLLQALRYLVVSRRWTRAVDAAVPDADIWQSEGLVTLPVALALKRRRGGRVVYDSRDVHVESGRFARLPGPWRRLLQRRERAWAASCDALVTVSRPYADVLARTLRRRADAIVMNCPEPWTPPDPPERRFHARLTLASDVRVVLYLGQLAPDRGIEQLCQAIGAVERAALVLVGPGAEEGRLRALAGSLAHADRIHLLPAVPPAEIPNWIAAADVSAMPVQPSTLNHRLNTPTKLFDAMGAGTPVVASDLPGMAPIVRETGCGVLCDPRDPGDIARAIRAVVDATPERRAELRAACLDAARGPYSWSRQAEVLLALYDRLLD